MENSIFIGLGGIEDGSYNSLRFEIIFWSLNHLPFHLLQHYNIRIKIITINHP
ncbi:hypothetical protein HanRHA438_Chr11g0494411 [Helianthus annuus]|nr:hypothetical protein HanRHA438_Chr11g0494411 [Helianthus annuus]